MKIYTIDEDSLRAIIAFATQFGKPLFPDFHPMDDEEYEAELVRTINQFAIGSCGFDGALDVPGGQAACSARGVAVGRSARARRGDGADRGHGRG